jgi:hypothetical protein
LDDLNRITHAGGVFFIVSHKLGPTADIFFIDRVLNQTVDQDHHGLVHFVGNHYPDYGLIGAPAFHGLPLVDGGLGLWAQFFPNYRLNPSDVTPNLHDCFAILNLTHGGLKPTDKDNVIEILFLGAQCFHV